MGKIHFILRGNKEEKTIYLVLRKGKNSNLKYSLRFTVKPIDWNPITMRVRNKVGILDKNEINNYLDELETVLKKFFSDSVANNDEVTFERIKKFLFDYTHPKEKTNSNLINFLNDYITETNERKSISTGKDLVYGTKQRFKELKNDLEEYAKLNNQTLSFADIDLKFYYSFVRYLENNRNLSLNTVGRCIRTLKTILNSAESKGIVLNTECKSAQFKILREEVMNIYLNYDEIEKIENVDLNPSLDNARKLFLIGCYTGLRFSDFSRLTIDNITDNGKHIKIKQQKTGGYVTLPLHPYLRDNILPYIDKIKPITNQALNRAIKEICRLAEINDPVVREYTKGGRKEKETYEKWEVVKTHTARRSFATNMHNDGISDSDIMKMTGHKTTASFAKYLKITDEDVADRIIKQWEEKENKRKEKQNQI